MAVGIFPVVKLGLLFLKQISKPLAKVLVGQAKNHPIFRNRVIIPIAQGFHWMEVKAKMYMMNLGKPTKVAKLNEQMAIELGANLMGEVIIFCIAGAGITLEWKRQSAKEAKKEAAREAQTIQFSDDIQGLFETSAQQEKQLKYLTSVIEELAKNPKHKVDIDQLKRLLEPVEESLRDKSGGNSDKIKNNNGNNSDKINDENNNNKSMVHRAIGYFEKDVKGST